MNAFGRAYSGLPVLVTGHTGFKGSWLASWLHELGAQVTGLALAPRGTPNHWDLVAASLGDGVADVRCDIRDAAAVAAAFAQARPRIVFHLAAQTLVRESYGDPLASWSTNVMGTANVLEACRRTPGVQAVVVITTDKVYANREWHWGYRENDPLGGHDPYSASKAATELVVESYRKSFWNDGKGLLLASARAGNVIGGGDWAADRLLPDLARACARDEALRIRSPRATRPWQHVLDCLSGYLLLGRQLLAGRTECADAWNFGPSQDDNRTVAEVLDLLARHWPGMRWTAAPSDGPHEAGMLHLDSTKARRVLGWRPAWTLDEALRTTAQWYGHHLRTGEALTRAQLRAYMEKAAADAKTAGGQDGPMADGLDEPRNDRLDGGRA